MLISIVLFVGHRIFTDDDGIAGRFCQHVMVFVDWAGEATVGPDVSPGLSDRLDEIEPGDPGELAELFGDEAVVIELNEPGRGGGVAANTLGNGICEFCRLRLNREQAILG